MTLNAAHELAPRRSSILLERAAINRQLGRSEDAADDQRRAMQIGFSSLVSVKMLEERIQLLKNELLGNRGKSETHLELGMAYHGLALQRNGLLDQGSLYGKAVKEYAIVIDSEDKAKYPQAHALVALC